ncbi:MAG: MFS transporter [Ignavibacteriales bacterium]|nr:MFS transporter [Ignavibacteriales bacterium]
MPRKRLSLVAVFVVVFIDLLGFGALIPILPTIAVNKFAMSETQVGVVLAVYSLAQFFANPIFGKLSDKYGRRPIILLTLAVNALGYAAFAFSFDFWTLLLSRVVSGVGGGSIGVAQAYIADVTEPSERSRGMGLIGAAFGLGFVFGPIVGGWLATYGVAVVGMASASFSTAAFLFTLFVLPESRAGDGSESRLAKLFDVGAYRRVVFHSRASTVVHMMFLETFAFANIYGTLALLADQKYLMDEFEIGTLYAVVGVVSAFTQGWLVGKASARIGDRWTLLIGSLVMTAGLSVTPYSSDKVMLIVVFGVTVFGLGFTVPTLLSLVSRAAPAEAQGETLGVNHSLASLARALGPLWGGYAYEHIDKHAPFETGALFIAPIVIFAAFYLPKLFKREREEQSTG